MLYLKGCPKCKTGAIELQDDPYGAYWLCLSCGYTRDLPDNAEPLPELVKAWRDIEEDDGIAEESVA